MSIGVICNDSVSVSDSILLCTPKVLLRLHENISPVQTCGWVGGETVKEEKRTVGGLAGTRRKIALV